jgi:transposase InsO family protein
MHFPDPAFRSPRRPASSSVVRPDALPFCRGRRLVRAAGDVVAHEHRDGVNRQNLRDKDVVRRILAARYQPTPDTAGPSWLTVLVTRRTVCGVWICFGANRPSSTRTWVLVVMDQWTRRIVGFGVHRGVVDGVALGRMFNRATCGQSLPNYLSADHDPLYRFHQWQANLRILDIRETRRCRTCRARILSSTG